MAFQVPLSAKSGKLQVTADGLSRTSADDFQIVPVVKKVTPACAVAGQTIEINGYGFTGVGSAAAYVKIGDGPERVADAQTLFKITRLIPSGRHLWPGAGAAAQQPLGYQRRRSGSHQPDGDRFPHQQEIEGQTDDLGQAHAGERFPEARWPVARG